VQDPSKSAQATVTVAMTISLSVNPTPVRVGDRVTVSAQVNGAANPAVTWSCSAGTFGTPNTWSNVTNIPWTAPSSVGTITLTATSVADPTKSTTLSVPVTVKVQLADPPAVQTGSSYQFQAQVLGSPDARVTWSMVLNGGSEAGATLSSTGLITVPASVPPGHRPSYLVTATSVVDPTQSDSRTVTIYQPAGISVTPVTATVPMGAVVNLSASVVGTDVQADYVLWVPLGGNLTLPNSFDNRRGGTSATWTAPRTTGSYRVTVAPLSRNSYNPPPIPGVSATATFTVVQAPAQVTLVPGTVALETGGTQQYQAQVTGVVDPSVTWTCTGGTISTQGLYTAPATTGTYTITAKSIADPSGTASTTVVVRAATGKPKITVSPKAATILPGASQTITSTLVNAGTATTRWDSYAYDPGTFTSSGSTATYTAPSTYPFQNGPSRTIDASAWVNNTWYRQDLYDRAIVTVQPSAAINITMDPSNRYEFIQGDKFQFKATVTGATDNRVIWSGALFPTGEFDSTSFRFGSGSYSDSTITATSLADTTRVSKVSIRTWKRGAVRLFGTPGLKLIPGQQTQLDWEVKGGGGVTWSLSAWVTNPDGSSGPTTNAGSISTTGLYTAPSTVTGDTWVTIQATNALDPTSMDTYSFNVVSVGFVDVAPSQANVTAGSKQTFTAKVYGSTASVTWSVKMADPASTLSPGTISRTGVYTAPASLGTNEYRRDVLVLATNASDSTKVGYANVFVYPAPTPLTPPTAGFLDMRGVTSLWTGTIRVAYYTGTGTNPVTWSIQGGTILSTGQESLGYPPRAYCFYQTGAAGTSLTLKATESNSAGSVTVTSPTVSVIAIPVFGGKYVYTDTSNVAHTYAILDFGTVTETTSDGKTTTYRKVWVNGLQGSLRGNDVSASGSYVGSFTNDGKTFLIQGINATLSAPLTPGVIIGVDPAEGAYVQTGTTLQLHSGVGGTSNVAVTWTATGGTLSSSGLYTPPATVGTYTVTATSQADPTQSYSIKVGVDTGTTIPGIAGQYSGTATYDGTDPRTIPVSVFSDAGSTYVKLYGVNQYAGNTTAVAQGTLVGRTFQGTYYEYNPSWYSRDPRFVRLVFERQTNGSLSMTGGWTTLHAFPVPGGGTTYGSQSSWAAFSGPLSVNVIDVAVVPHMQDGYYGSYSSYGAPEPPVLSGTALPFRALVCGSTNTSVTWSAANSATGAVPATAFSTTTGSSTIFTVPEVSQNLISFAVTAKSVADPTKSDAAGFPVNTTAGTLTVNPTTVYLADGLDPIAAQGWVPTSSHLTVSFPLAPSDDASWAIQQTGDSGVIALDTTYLSEAYANYTPGSTPGTYTVVATSKWDATRKASGTITVLEGNPQLLYPSASPSPVVAGSPVTLAWLGAWAFKTPNPTVSLQIRDNVTGVAQTVDVTGANTYTFAPGHNSTATFTVISASGKMGTSTVPISLVPNASIASFEANPSYIRYGDPLTVVATFTGVNGTLYYQDAYGWQRTFGPITSGVPVTIPAGHEALLNRQPMIKMSCQDSYGNQVTSSWVTVPCAPVIQVFTASPSGILLGSGASTTISWGMNSAGLSGTATLTATPQGGSAMTLTSPTASSGTFTHTPTVTTTYTLTLSTSVGGVTKSASVRVAEVASVQISPTTARIAPGESMTFQAAITALPGKDGLVWSASGGTVQGSGTTATYTAPSAPGSYQVIATSAADPSVQAIAVVTVSVPTVTISISPTAVTLGMGQTLTFGSNIQVVGGTNLGVTWSATGGSISQNGFNCNYVAPFALGTYTVTVTSVADPTKSATATVTVANSGTSIVTVSPLLARLYVGQSMKLGASFQGTSTDQTLNWTTTGGVVVGNGLSASYTAPATPGTYSVTATSLANGTNANSTTVQVLTPAPTAPLSVVPEAATLGAGDTMNFSAVDDVGNPASAVVWNIQEENNAGTMSSAGTYVAPAIAGTYHVVARNPNDPNQQAVGTITVLPPPTSTMISPETLTLAPGQSFHFGYRVTSGTVTWSTNGGNITSDGLYTAPIIPGSYAVGVTSVVDPTKNAVCTVLVQDPNAVRVQISPTTLSLGVGQSFAFGYSATAGDVTWSATGGVITPAGIFTAPMTQGTYSVSAISSLDPSQIATSTVTVVASASSDLVISPDMVGVQAGAKYRFAYSILPGGLTWSTTGGSVASDGTYTAPGVGGQYTITATSQADPTKSAQATAFVFAPQPQTLEIWPKMATLNTGDTLRFAYPDLPAGLTWKSSGGNIGPDGTYTAPLLGGVYSVSATDQGDPTRIAYATVTVKNPGGGGLVPISNGLEVYPPQTAIAAGTPQTFKVAGATPVAWTVVGNPPEAVVDMTGVFKASKRGFYQVVATSLTDSTQSGSAVVEVQSSLSPINQAPTAILRGYTATRLTGGKILIAGGNDGTQYLANAYLYDPETGIFTPTGSLRQARAYHTATLMQDGRVLIAGGMGSFAWPGDPNATVKEQGVRWGEVYNPVSGAFEALAVDPAHPGFPAGYMRSAHAQVGADSPGSGTLLANGQVLVTGGTDSGTNYSDVFDPTSNQFDLSNIVPDPQGSGWVLQDAPNSKPTYEGQSSVTLDDGRAFLTGGVAWASTPQTRNQADVFSGSSQSFNPVGHMLTPRSLHTVTKLLNGKVLIVGGFDTYLSAGNGWYFGRSTPTAELYDPATGSFSPTGSLNSSRAAHSALLLPSGEVLITGGLTGDGTNTYLYPKTVEIYDPASGTFRVKDTLDHGLDDPHLAGLSDNEAFMSGIALDSTIINTGVKSELNRIGSRHLSSSSVAPETQQQNGFGWWGAIKLQNTQFAIEYSNFIAAAETPRIPISPISDPQWYFNPANWNFGLYPNLSYMKFAGDGRTFTQPFDPRHRTYQYIILDTDFKRSPLGVVSGGYYPHIGLSHKIYPNSEFKRAAVNTIGYTTVGWWEYLANPLLVFSSSRVIFLKGSSGIPFLPDAPDIDWLVRIEISPKDKKIYINAGIDGFPSTSLYIIPPNKPFIRSIEFSEPSSGPLGLPGPFYLLPIIGDQFIQKEYTYDEVLK
jgi:hypothetical protein